MRSQRFSAAAIAAASVTSLVTSASKATHSPPACLTIDTVSSAERRWRSTTMIFAPSWANRRAVARPLPIPSPGLCPAPITMAVFPSRRMVASQRMTGSSVNRFLDLSFLHDQTTMKAHRTPNYNLPTLDPAHQTDDVRLRHSLTEDG